MMKLNRRAMIALAAAATAAMTPALAQETTTATSMGTPGDFSLGSPDAKVKLVEPKSLQRFEGKASRTIDKRKI